MFCGGASFHLHCHSYCVCVCVYACVYMHMRVCICICMCIHAHASAFMHTFLVLLFLGSCISVLFLFLSCLLFLTAQKDHILFIYHSFFQLSPLVGHLLLFLVLYYLQKCCFKYFGVPCMEFFFYL